MRYVRFIYFLFLITLLGFGFLIGRGPSQLRRAPRPEYEYKAKVVLGFCLVSFFGLLAIKQLHLDWRYRKAKIRKKYKSAILINELLPLNFGVFSGEGLCSIDITIHRSAKSASRDSFEIYRLENGKKIGAAALAFAFDKETYQIRLSDASKWEFALEIRPECQPSEPFKGEVMLRISSEKPIGVPERFTSQ